MAGDTVDAKFFCCQKMFLHQVVEPETSGCIWGGRVPCEITISIFNASDNY